MKPLHFVKTTLTTVVVVPFEGQPIENMTIQHDDEGFHFWQELTKTWLPLSVGDYILLQSRIGPYPISKEDFHKTHKRLWEGDA